MVLATGIPLLYRWSMDLEVRQVGGGFFWIVR